MTDDNEPTKALIRITIECETFHDPELMLGGISDLGDLLSLVDCVQAISIERTGDLFWINCATCDATQWLPAGEIDEFAYRHSRGEHE